MISHRTRKTHTRVPDRCPFFGFWKTLPSGQCQNHLALRHATAIQYLSNMVLRFPENAGADSSIRSDTRRSLQGIDGFCYADPSIGIHIPGLYLKLYIPQIMLSIG